MRDRVGVGVESCKIVFLGALPIHLFRHFCYRMYRMCRLATMYSVTDRQRVTQRRRNRLTDSLRQTGCEIWPREALDMKELNVMWNNGFRHILTVVGEKV